MGVPIDIMNTVLELGPWDAETYYQNLYLDMEDDSIWRGVANFTRGDADINRDRVHQASNSRRIGVIKMHRS